MTYCDVFALLGLDLDEISETFPIMKRRLRVAGCRGMIRDSYNVHEDVVTYNQRGKGGGCPRELDDDASVADVAIKQRVDGIFAFCLSLCKPGGDKPQFPADTETVFRQVAGRAITPPGVGSGGGGLGDAGVGEVLAAMARIVVSG